VKKVNLLNLKSRGQKTICINKILPWISVAK
jgi:hypothetical protein